MPPQPLDPNRADQPPVGATPDRVLADLGEDELLRLIFPLLPPEPRAVIGPGDDAAVLGLSYGAVVLTTDTMVLGSDWRDEWSSAADVGAKVVAQNLADIAAMGAVPVGLLVTLIADPSTPVAWAVDLAGAIGDAAAIAGTGVLGGDLSSAPPGLRAVSVTALGDLEGRSAVTRTAARPGDVIAVNGTLGHAAAGLRLLFDSAGERSAGADSAAGGIGAPGPRPAIPAAGAPFVAVQRRPTPPLAAGPQAAAAGVHALIDLSDGLVRDAGRVARASGVDLDLDLAALRPDIEAIAAVLGEQTAQTCVLTGGEDHSLLGCFSAQVPLPAGWRRIGAVRAAASALSGETEAGGAVGRVLVDGAVPEALGWDHFGG